MLTRVKTFDDGRRVDEISPAQHAHEVRVKLGDLYPGGPVHFVRGEATKKTQPARKGDKEEREGVRRCVCSWGRSRMLLTICGR